MKRFFWLLYTLCIAVILPMEFFVPVSYAQEATVSAAPTDSVQASSSAIPKQQHPWDTNLFNDAENVSQEEATPHTLDQLVANSINNMQSSDLKALKQKSVIHDLQKKNYNATEAVTMTIGNATADTVTVTVTDPVGHPLSAAYIQKTTIDTQTTVSIIPHSAGFRPGKYKVMITDADGQTKEQDFTWGVLAMNMDKSIYQPNETAQLSMAVLDDQGNMVCDAQMSLEITDPSGNKTLLSTSTKTITVNSQCMSHNFSLIPDYQASYTVHGPGMYAMQLSATTKNGTNTLQDAILVKQYVPFVVSRTSATRIYPANTYPMLFGITAQQDFDGTITETVPENFTITPYASESAKSYDSSQSENIVPSMQQIFGVSSLHLQKPFSGTFVETQGFGAALTDPEEKALYQKFGLLGHDGLDFALPSGTAVVASDGGVVSLAGDGAYGTTVVIDHPWGRSYYGHLSQTEVRVGDHVVAGQEVGLSGNTGLSTGAHLHFGIKPKFPDVQNGYFGKVDPSPFLNLASLPNQLANTVLAASTSAVLQQATTSAAITPVIATLPVPKTITNNKVTVLRWHVTLKKGDKISLGYQFKAPDISPQLYLLGPLRFYPSEAQPPVFQEARQWQIAADLVGTRWFNPGWAFRKKITIDHTKVANTTQSNFPVLVSLSSDASLSANAQINGNDIVFTDSTGVTQLMHQIENYSSGTLAAWVKIPTLSTTTDTVLYMYYGNASATNQQNATAVWDSNYLGVWHLSDNAANTTVADATSVGNTGTNVANTSTKTTSGQIANGLTYNGTSDETATTTNGSIKGQSQVTISGWVKTTTVSSGAQQDIYFEPNNTSNSNTRIGLVINGGTEKFELYGRVNDGDARTSFAASTNALTISTWYYVVGVYDSINSLNHININGVDQTTAASESTFSSTTPINVPYIGGQDNASPPNWWSGTLDEVRVSKTARSADWNTTEYNNQSSPSTFYTLGAVETSATAVSLNLLMRGGKYFDQNVVQPFTW